MEERQDVHSHPKGYQHAHFFLCSSHKAVFLDHRQHVWAVGLLSEYAVCTSDKTYSEAIEIMAPSSCNCRGCPTAISLKLFETERWTFASHSHPFRCHWRFVHVITRCIICNRVLNIVVAIRMVSTWHVPVPNTFEHITRNESGASEICFDVGQYQEKVRVCQPIYNYANEKNINEMLPYLKRDHDHTAGHSAATVRTWYWRITPSHWKQISWL